MAARYGGRLRVDDIDIAIITTSGLVDQVCAEENRALVAALGVRGQRAAVLAWSRHSIPPSTRMCVVRSAYDYAIRPERFFAWAEETSRVVPVWHKPKTLRWCANKFYLRDLAAQGVATIPTTCLEAGAQTNLSQLFDEHDCDCLIIKPAVGVAARELLRVPRAAVESAQLHVEKLLARESVVVQPYLASIEVEGELSVVFVEGEICHAVRRIPKPGDYRAHYLFGCAEAPVRLSGEQSAVAASVIAALGADAMFGRIDFVTGAGGALLVSEAELVSPVLYFRQAPEISGRVADAICHRLGMSSSG